jgi:hypothetical protein
VHAVWKPFVADFSKATWRYGRPRPEGAPREETWRNLGDFEKGPWIYIIERAANLEVRPHSHDQDEIVYIIEGGLIYKGQSCGPGTVLSFPRRFQYGFTVGPEGVMWIMYRTGPSEGETAEDWQNHEGLTFEVWRAERDARRAAAAAAR